MQTTTSTTTQTTDDELMKRAMRRVDIKVGFATHLLVFVVVNLGLYVVNHLYGGHRWALYSLFGWGLGLLIHGVVTLVELSGDGLRERLVDAEVHRLRQRN